MVLLGIVGLSLAPAQGAPRTPVFRVIDVFVDSGETPLAAYQFRLVDPAGHLEIVGLEGGEHPAYASAPYYDPAALSQNRIIVAAFDTGDQVPVGRTRVASLHVQTVEEDPEEYEIELEVAAGPEGQRIDALVSLERRN